MECTLMGQTLLWARASLGDLVRGHDLGQAGNVRWAGGAVDSRTDCAGSLFFAIKGDVTDGHRFIQQAFAAGCVGAVVDDPTVTSALADAGIPYLLVTESRRALQELARAHRDSLQVRVVAITGSSGKTTTKEYVRAILRSKFRVHANPGNYNSLVGVPLTVLQADEDIEYLVCEVGANQTGEVAFLSGLLRPDIGVITNIGDAHIGLFGSRRAIAEAKSELFDAMGSSARVVLPRDDEFFEVLRSRVTGKCLTYGQTTQADFQLADVETTRSGVSFTINGEPMNLPVLGTYNAENAAAAFAVADISGVEVERARKALAETMPMPGRGRIRRSRDVVLIDESYNASPASMARSLAMLAGVPAARRVAIMGDMLELGESSEEAHRTIAERVAALALDRVVWVGSYGQIVSDTLKATGRGTRCEIFPDVDALLTSREFDSRPGDVILVKASRGCMLDRYVAGWLIHTEGNDQEGTH